MKKKRKIPVWVYLIAAALIVTAVLLMTRGKKIIRTGNLLQNGDFMQLDDQGLPVGWYTDDYLKTPGYTDYSAEAGEATIVNHDRNDARFAQIVEVEPDSLYCLRGEIRAEAEGGLGANLSIADVYVFSECVYNTDGEWQEVVLYGQTGASQRQVTIFARLGGYSGEAAGSASFRNISLEQVADVPANQHVTYWYAQSGASSAADSGEGSPAWPWLLLVACAYGAACFLLRRQVMEDRLETQKRRREWLPVAVMLLLAVAGRVLIAALIPGYGVDIGCFTAWGAQLAQHGAANFYDSVGFCDYPPGYILVLGLLAKIGGGLGVGMTEMLVKLPSILCDAAAAGVLYCFLRRHTSRRAAFALAALYAANPLTFAAGAAWGQADSVMTLFLLLVVTFAIEGKWAAALPLYMTAVLMKPQALMFGPLGLLALICALIKKPDKKLLIQTGIGLALTAAVGAAVILPFSPNMDNSEGWWIIKLYQNTMGYYDNATINACNLYFLFGKNWLDIAVDAEWYIRLSAVALLAAGLLAVGLRKKWYIRGALRLGALCAAAVAMVAAAVIPMTYGTLGTVMIALCVALCCGLYLAGGNIRHLPLLGAVMLILLCNLGVMMHERYVFAAVALLALACALERDRRVYLLFAAVSVCAFLNVGVVLDRGIRIGGVDGHLHAPLFGILSDSAALEYILSGLNCLIAAFAGLTAVSVCAEGERAAMRAPAAEAEQPQAARIPSPAVRELQAGSRIQPMQGLDWLLMLGVTAVYAVAALVNLGATKSPQTWWRSSQTKESVVLDLGESHAMNMLYLGGIHRQNVQFTVRTSDDLENWSEPNWAEIQEGDCFKWQYVQESAMYDGQRNYYGTPLMMFGRYVQVEAQNLATTIYEVVLRDPQTKTAYPVTLVSGNGEHLIDEQDAFSGEPGWYNSTYFDEIYHARTGYEHYQAMTGDTTYMPYETSHPPLGKVLIAFSIGIFGMTPFGWRFAGALAGILMLPGMYLLGRMLFKRRIAAFLSMFLMAVDFMHFTQTRIATIDSFVVLFILWSMVFMVYYMRMDYWGVRLWKTLVPLGLSGLFFGFAIASKWTGVYAGVGLAVLFFWTLYRRYTQSLAAREILPGGAAAREIYLRPLVTLGCCVLFFIVIPLSIYYISYIPYFLPYSPPGVTVRRVIQAAVGDWLYGGDKGGMLGYHSTPGLGMNHPFYSPWYEWPVIKKPMWYYSSAFHPDDATQTIVAFGNPLVWWGGLAAMIAVALIWAGRHVTRQGGVQLHTPQNDTRPAILLIGFAAQFVPWTLVPRGTYIYHYFPSVPFIILAVALCVDLLYDALEKPLALPAWHYRLAAKSNQWFNHSVSEELREKAAGTITLRWQRLPLILTIALMAISLGLFIAFFPYISGCWAGYDWLRAMQWFNGWIYY